MSRVAPYTDSLASVGYLLWSSSWNTAPNFKNSRFEPPFEGVRGYAQGQWLDAKRTVDFLLVIIELFSLALTTEALLWEICRNRRFSEGVNHFECKF